MGENNALLSCFNIDVNHVKGTKFDREYNRIVYSVTNENRVVLNCSRHGKEYSANVFYEWFSDGKRPISPQQQNIPLHPLINENQRTDHK